VHSDLRDCKFLFWTAGEVEMNVKQEARAVLSAAGITTSQDFNSLAPAQLAAVRDEAATAYERKHGRPMSNGNAAYLRRRYDLLQLRARSS
jgi:hypothetical protein